MAYSRETFRTISTVRGVGPDVTSRKIAGTEAKSGVVVRGLCPLVAERRGRKGIAVKMVVADQKERLAETERVVSPRMTDAPGMREA